MILISIALQAIYMLILDQNIAGSVEPLASSVTAV